MNVMTLIGTIFNEVKDAEKGYYSLDKTEDGKLTAATVNFEKLARYVVKKFVTLPEGDPKWTMIDAMIAVLPGQVLGGNALKINLAGIPFEYGKLAETDRVATKDLVFNLREDETFTGGKDQAYVSKITNIEAIGGTGIEVGSEVTVTGTDFAGNKVVTTGKVMAIYDGNYYVGILTDFYANYDDAEAIVNGLISEADKQIDLSTLIKPNWPFYGVLTCPVPAQA